MLLRLFVKMTTSMVIFLICSIANRIAYSYALKLFGYLASFLAMCACSGSLKISDLIMLACPSLSRKERGGGKQTIYVVWL